MYSELSKLKADWGAQLCGTRQQKSPPYTVFWMAYRFFSYEFFTVIVYRLAAGFHGHTLTKPFSLFLYFFHKLLFKVDMHPGSTIGEGLQLVHGFGVVIGSQAVLGINVAIFDGVSIGKKNVGQSGGMPKIGDNVVLGAGAKILGGIEVADNCTVGANSVVITSCYEPDSLLVGVPSKNISRNKMC